MKKVIKLLLVVSILSGCSNHRIIDIKYNYEYAIIELPNGQIIEGKVDSWADSESDSICITINGIDYYTSTNKATLMSKKPN